MKVRSHILSPSIARGVVILCAAAFVTSAPMAQAGINVWRDGRDVTMMETPGVESWFSEPHRDEPQWL